MKKFALKTKETGEVINTISAKDINGAADMFATLKNITKEQLLNIFNVDFFIYP
jgi:hypothetical protein